MMFLYIKMHNFPPKKKKMKKHSIIEQTTGAREFQRAGN